jgi:hypothetical protein
MHQVVSKEELDQPTRDIWFNPYRAPKTERAWAVVNDVLGQVQALERFHKLRRRVRRPADQEVFEATVTAVVADLMHLQLLRHPAGLVVARSKDVLGRRSRYRPAIYNKTFPTVLDRLSTPEMSFIEQTKGAAVDFDTGRRLRTTIRPGWRLTTRVEEHGLTFDDLTTTSEGEIIILKNTKDDYWDEAHFVEYEDTETTLRYREEMRTINDWLSRAEIAFQSRIQPDLGVDVSNRRLRRIFTRNSFESGGRLFGGFWQPLTKTVRLERLRINGEPVVSLDYSQMNPMIAYGLARAKPNMNDLYAIPGYEQHRAGVKKLFNAMLFKEKPITRMPKGLRPLLPNAVEAKDAARAVADSHPAISSYFYSGSGHYLQFIESEIMVRLLLDLKDKGIAGLPVHDSVVVQRSKADVVREAMINQFRAATGIDVSVTEEVSSVAQTV